MEKKKHTGKVVIAGAGPGDPELLTLKAARALQCAEVILVDRLVSDVIIPMYANLKAEIIHVGKQCRRGVSTSQESINELMVKHAKAGKYVVRLKGGDVSIFSNILDELETLAANDIPYEIIPGVTAALGAAAYSGIPLTARGYSTGVRFLTFYKSDVISEKYWKELAASDDTLVFYMASETLQGVIENLVSHNIAEEKLLAVVEQATTPFQQVHVTSLYEYEKNLKGKTFLSPSLVIIGKAVALQKQFAWFRSRNPEHENYFEELSASVKNLITQNKPVYAGRA
ncbi:MAG TPA: uroporphyrinogen-III C-methyltransferase [Chitinophagaceae bacterium]|nr:uroporphyrinogen-III C-methyltransferase [Chitinophagaceae bacterium]